MPDTRLIERWLPIAALGEESVRERTSYDSRYLATYYRLHVWWARRPLVSSRAAVLASLLPADADREKFMHVLGIHGDPVAARRWRIDALGGRARVRVDNPYGYDSRFRLPSWIQSDRALAEIDMLGRFHKRHCRHLILDPTGRRRKYSIRNDTYGFCAQAIANDLNPVV